MQKFNATLYGYNMPVMGTVVSAYFVGQRLFIDNMPIELHSSQLSVSVGGIEHDELFLNWCDSEGVQWALKAVSRADIELIANSAPQALQPHLSKWHHRHRHHKTFWGLLGAAVATVVFVLALLLWQYQHMVSWVTSQIPISAEQQLGQAALAQIKAEGDIIESGKAVVALAEIGNKVTRGSNYQYQWLIKQDETVNAFALPSGIIVVHSALIQKADNAEELAAVLAHEVQHVEQRHSLKNMIHSAGWAVVLAVVLGDVSGVTAVIAHQVGSSYFSRELESEADKLGYATLVKAKIKPDGMVSFLQKLADLSQQQPTALAWISSHPDTLERVADIKQLLKEQPCDECKSLIINWQSVQQALPKIEALKQ
ncbi:MAG: M48 family metallopeptidase [Agitococcus sp.]